MEANGIQAGQLLPLNIAELQVAGFAHVTAIEPCPQIASGDGSVITGRFVTRQVDTIARVEILGAYGSIEVLEGTTIHPIWSLDRNDWVPLGELKEGEQLLGQAGPALVLTHAILHRSLPVYNIEVHGVHVYEVGEFGVLVHNLSEDCFVWASKHLDEIGGQMRHLKPTAANPYPATGFLPGDNPQFAAYAYHTLIEKGGKYYDEIFDTGVEIGQWVDEFKRLNDLSDDLFDLWYIIDDIPHFGVRKL